MENTPSYVKKLTDIDVSVMVDKDGLAHFIAFDFDTKAELYNGFNELDMFNAIRKEAQYDPAKQE
jgi:hypothetical protein